jgi:hypothetical protein
MFATSWDSNVSDRTLVCPLSVINLHLSSHVPYLRCRRHPRVMPHGGRMGPISCDVERTGGNDTRQARYKESGAQGQGNREATGCGGDRSLQAWRDFGAR